MEEDYAPRGHHISTKARNTVLKTFRKFKERPCWFFRRVDKNQQALEVKDQGTYFSEGFLADLYLHPARSD